MTYDSPTKLRNQERQAEKPRKAKRIQTVKITSDKEWGKKCNAMLFRVDSYMWQRQGESAGRCAEALVHMAIERRACQLRREFELLTELKAIDIARIELLGKEPA